MVSLCNLGWSGICFADQAGCKALEICLLKSCIHALFLLNLCKLDVYYIEDKKYFNAQFKMPTKPSVLICVTF